MQELKNFPKYCQNISELDNNISPQSLCQYLNGINNAVEQFESKLDELDTKHSKVKKMRIDSENLAKLIAKGE